jgi:hypothetical protein
MNISTGKRRLQPPSNPKGATLYVREPRPAARRFGVPVTCQRLVNVLDAAKLSCIYRAPAEVFVIIATN